MFLTKEQSLQIYEELKYAYRPIVSRFEVGKKSNKEKELSNVCQHVLLYDVPADWNDKVANYKDVSENVKNLLGPFINKALSIVKENTKSYKYIFFILSTNLCGKDRHVKHLHTIIQNDPQRNITFSVPIPLYIDETNIEHHKFYFSYDKQLFPKITYTSHIRMENLNVHYDCINVPKKLSSLLFDSARTVHYIDNTSHMYLWLVCDGVELYDKNMVEGVKLTCYDNFL